MKQEWCCDWCGKSGEAKIPKGEDVWGGLARVSNSHFLESTHCSNPEIRVRNRKLCTAAMWEEVKKSARISALKRQFIVDCLPGHVTPAGYDVRKCIEGTCDHSGKGTGQ
jgi:hypothetical protein